MLSLKQTAEKIGVHWKTVRTYCLSGKIKAVKIGRDWKIAEDEIEHILKNGLRG